MQFVDSHCHLNFNCFQDDLEDVISRARQQGIERMVIPGIDIETSEQAIALAERFDEIYAAVGVHPSEADSWQPNTYNKIQELASSPKVVAIGEIGLDFYHTDNPPGDVQLAVLKSQLEIAAITNLPVILHSRSAEATLLQVLFEWRKNILSPQSPKTYRLGVLHAFEGSENQIQEAVAQGFMIGIGGPITYRRTDQKRQQISRLPLGAVLLETDAPFLPPQPHRGQRNEPAYIPLIAAKIAEVMQVSIERIAEMTTSNASQLFLWNRQI